MGIDEFIVSDEFDVMMIRYNLIYQEAFDTFLDLAQRHDVGITVMRPMTSGIFQKIMRAAHEGIDEILDLNSLCLQFVLSDPRVASAIVGMRRPSEVLANHRVSTAVERLDLEQLHRRRADPETDNPTNS
jgi:predicted aldo/keto reductase-like oxidoreductase